MTIRERDRALDQEYRAKTGHSLHEARWALCPSYNPDEEIPFEPTLMQRIIGETVASAIVIGAFIWLCYWMTH